MREVRCMHCGVFRILCKIIQERKQINEQTRDSRKTNNKNIVKFTFRFGLVQSGQHTLRLPLTATVQTRIDKIMNAKFRSAVTLHSPRFPQTSVVFVHYL